MAERTRLYVDETTAPVLDSGKGKTKTGYLLGYPFPADFLGKERQLMLQPGDLLAVRSAGAYGFVMASNYNTRPRAAEVMVDGTQCHLVRKRETVA